MLGLDTGTKLQCAPWGLVAVLSRRVDLYEGDGADGDASMDGGDGGSGDNGDGDGDAVVVEADMYEVALIGWKLADGTHPTAFVSAATLHPLPSADAARVAVGGGSAGAEAVAALGAASASSSSALNLSTPGSTSTSAASAAAAVAAASVAKVAHWSNRLYKVSRLYRNANVLRSYQLEGLNWILRCYYQRR